MKSLALPRIFENPEKKAFWVLVSIAVLAIGVYIYCICASVANIVLRKETSIELSTVSSHVGNLESEYLQRKTSLNKEYAESLGFTDIQHTAFVSKVSTNDTSLTFNR
jgi:hypothetical protein